MAEGVGEGAEENGCDDEPPDVGTCGAVGAGVARGEGGVEREKKRR